MVRIRYKLITFVQQLEELLRGDVNLHSVKLVEKSVTEKGLDLEVQSELNQSRVLKNAELLARIRFPERQVSSISVEDGHIHIQFRNSCSKLTSQKTLREN